MNLSSRYHPALLLASLGAGGLAVSFYLYLLFLTPHPGLPVPTIDTLLNAPSPPLEGWWGVPWALALLFSALHFILMFWNLPRYRLYQAIHHAELRSGDSAFVRFAWPLLLAMSMNSGFVIALLSIPGFWVVIEYIFPLAMLGFLGLGLFTLQQLGELIAQSLQEKKSLLAANNLSSLMPAFALGMITVGLSGPAAMSKQLLTSSLALFCVMLIGIAALIVIVVFGIQSLGNVLRHGVAANDSYGLMILVPITTILGIAGFRVTMALAHHSGLKLPDVLYFLIFSSLLAIQIFVIWLGVALMKRSDAWSKLWSGDPVPSAFAVICPGVAFVVMLNFFFSRGVAALPGTEHLIALGWLLSATVQAVVTYLFLRLAWKLIRD